MATIVVVLCGRDAESSAIAGLLAAARRSRGGVLVVRGEPGIGKSALLGEAREHAGGHGRPARRSGSSPRRNCRSPASHQLLGPVLDHPADLPDAAGTRLTRCPRTRRRRRSEPFLVYLATLTLLSDVAGTGPLLCLVDDVQWLDEASADALVFVARRLSAEPIGLLLASRDGEADRFDVASLPELRLAGLDARPRGTARPPVSRSPCRQRCAAG